jgi:putative acetyltransferase
MTTQVRPEQPQDVAGIRAVLLDAFTSPAEAGLVDALRASGAWLPSLSVVAVDRADVLAYALLTRVRLDGAPVLALGPVAVLTSRRGQGLGGAVIRHALDTAAGQGETFVSVLGEPEYYARFGFVPAARYGVTGAWSQFGDAWQGLVLSGAGRPKPGEIVHPGPWHQL